MELRWRPGEHQAAFTRSALCMTEYDRFGGGSIECCAKCAKVQVAVDRRNCLQALITPAAHQRSAHLPVAPAFDVAGMLSADRDHRLDAVGRVQRAGQAGRHAQPEHNRRPVEPLTHTGRRTGWVRSSSLARASSTVPPAPTPRGRRRSSCGLDSARSDGGRSFVTYLILWI